MDAVERRGSIPLRHKSVVESSFGLDGPGGVVGSGVSAFGHHHAAVAIAVWSGWLAGP